MNLQFTIKVLRMIRNEIQIIHATATDAIFKQKMRGWIDELLTQE